MSNKSKIIITQEANQSVTAQDIINIELTMFDLYGLTSPLFVVFDKNSALASLLSYLRPIDSLIVAADWNGEEISTQLKQLLLVRNYIVVFYDDYNQAKSIQLQAFDDYALSKLNRILEFSLDSLRTT